MSEPAVVLPQPVRCAIYTRKSTEEGLEKDFNSLDAQREAAEAFIASQRQEGWLALAHIYNDGGYTGANMERPGLGKLLTDIEAQRVDCVVVYKVDRLSRSLLDFARMMSVFEKHDVSFVSVTQQFNTRTPVGRLTLNILLSFAQFEREIIRERTRDKKAAAKRKGKWTGGYLPLGYDLDAHAGKLVINEAEAEQVRAIFELFAETRSVAATLEEVHRRGWQTKSWMTAKQERHVGAEFREDSLRRLLSNPLYAGVIRYQDKSYPGEQPRIITAALWRRVQQALAALETTHTRKRENNIEGLLQGLLHCAVCQQPMSHIVSRRGQPCYRYYVCRNAHCRRPSVAAEVFERGFVAQLDKLSSQSHGAKLAGWLESWRGQSQPLSEMVASLRLLVECVTYDHRSGEVLVRLCGWKARGNARAQERTAIPL